MYRPVSGRAFSHQELSWYVSRAISPMYQQHNGDEEGQGKDMKSLLSGVYSKDWVNDFVEPDASVIEEGRKTIDFLLKR